MNVQHLSDEAVAAYADGVLGGLARERARRHTSACDECAQAVRVQREAALALRAATAPALPTGLLDRLRTVPQTTPVSALPTVIAPDGTTMLATFAPMAAFVPPVREPRTTRHNPMVAGAAAVALTGALAIGAAVYHGNDDPQPATGRAAQQISQQFPGRAARPDAPPSLVAPTSLFRAAGP